MTRRFLFLVVPVLAVILFSLASPAMADDYPSRTITIVVAEGPGVAIDLIARVLAPEMSKELGQPVIVENKPGADNMLGFGYVAKHAPADGYTMLVVPLAVQALASLTHRDLQFDPVKDLTPVIGIAQQTMFVVSSSHQPWHDFNGMVAYARQNPGKLNYGAASLFANTILHGMVQHLNIDATSVPYSSTTAMYQALLSGEVQLGFISASQAVSFGDQIERLAVASAEPVATFPQVPTLAQIDLGQFNTGSIFALDVATGTPKAVSDKLYAVVSGILRRPEVKAKLAKASVDVTDDPPDAVAADLARQIEVLGALIKSASN